MNVSARAAVLAVLGLSTVAAVASPMSASAGGDATTPIAATSLLQEMPADAARGLIDSTVYQPSSVVAQFDALSVKAEALGFGIGPSTDPTVCKHYQGIARAEGPGVPYLFVTQSRADTGSCVSEDEPGELLVVKMESRGVDGERLRSNRLAPGEDTVDTEPPPIDTTKTVITFDGSDCDVSDGITGQPGYRHPGGVQLVGDILAVPLENPIPDAGCPSSMVAFFDVSNPESPVLRSWKAFDFPAAGVVAVTRQSTGHFLMMVTGGGNEVLHFYRSQGTDLAAPDLAWNFVFDYHESQINAHLDPHDWPGEYQTFNFVREAGTGQLFLFGARNSHFPVNDGDDLLELYKVIEYGNTVEFEFVGQRHLYTVPTPESCGIQCEGDEEIANFAAASGVYVSPSGNLLLYATEHANDGPEVGDVATVKAAEWRHREIVRTHSPTLLPTAQAGGPYRVGEGGSIALSGAGAPPITRAWVELFADAGFDGRSIMIDYPDRKLDDFGDFSALEDDFSDEVSSMRWFAPKGCTFQLHVAGDVPRLYVGDGLVHRVTDFGLLNDKITSISWDEQQCDATYNSPAALSWDLDGDSIFESTGPAPAFPAHTLDGPTTRIVTLRATQAASELPGYASAAVEVANVAPSLSGAGAVDSLGNPLGPTTPFVLVGQRVEVGASFTDPGAGDTHVASVAWGDGAVDQGAAQVSFAYSHTYTQPGSYQAVVTVADDDGGTATEPITIQVLDPIAALEGIAGQLGELVDDGYGAAVNDALAEALQHLAGSGDGHAASGALDKLDDGDTEAAMVKLIAAVDALYRAEAVAGPDLDAAIDVLGLIGQALAQGAYADAQAAAPAPSPGQQKQLDLIAEHIASGIATLQTGHHVAALEDFTTAVHKAAALIS